MFELFSDPETIPFMQDSEVNLPKLKYEIDRRMLKILALLGQKGKKKRQMGR